MAFKPSITRPESQSVQRGSRIASPCTSLSEGMTPQGPVKVMNRYLSIMSEPIRSNRGIIDKYIGDGIVAYWGPPFVDEADHACFRMSRRPGND
jgi:class 3 adenylate cyclase